MLLKSSVVLLTIIGLIHCDVIDYKKANSILGRQNRKLTVSHRTHHTSFISFMKKYEKVYESETELMTRLHNFNENAKKYEEIQAKDIGTAKYGVSPFSDYSEEEVSFYTSGLKLKGRSPRNLPSDSYSKGFLDFKAESYPTEFDWRAKNVVAPVKKQGRCGSCWAFSVVGCIEGQYAIKNKKVVELSEQQLVDCDYYDDGCRGGYMSDAYQYLIEEGGIETERDYPYIGKRRYERECDFDLEDNKEKVRVLSYVNITTGEEDMKKYLYEKGPLSVALNAYGLIFYTQGVIEIAHDSCDPHAINHATLLVGYGEEKTSSGTIPYWLIKNSWGENWGDKGYFKIRRGKNTCGIASDVSAVNIE